MPDGRFLLQIFNEGRDLRIFSLIKRHAKPRRNILVFGVSVARAGFRRNQEQVSDHPGECTLTEGMKTGDRLAGDLALPIQASVDREGMSVTLRAARAKFNVVGLPDTRFDFRAGVRLRRLICDRSAVFGRRFSRGGCILCGQRAYAECHASSGQKDYRGRLMKKMWNLLQAGHARTILKWKEKMPMCAVYFEIRRKSAKRPAFAGTLYRSLCRLAFGDDRCGRFALSDEASPQAQRCHHQ